MQAEVALSHTDMDPKRDSISTTVFLQGACMGYAILWEGKWLVPDARVRVSGQISVQMLMLGNRT